MSGFLKEKLKKAENVLSKQEEDEEEEPIEDKQDTEEVKEQINK